METHPTALQRIIGVKPSTVEGLGMVALVCYTDGSYELVPTSVITICRPEVKMEGVLGGVTAPIMTVI